MNNVSISKIMDFLCWGFPPCRQDHAKAVDILVKDLKTFSTFNEELFKEITFLLTLGNFRYDEISW